MVKKKFDTTARTAMTAPIKAASPGIASLAFEFRAMQIARNAEVGKDKTESFGAKSPEKNTTNDAA